MGDTTHTPRTYAARVEMRRGVIPHMLPEPGKPTWVIHAEPLKRLDPNGGSRTSMGFPICVLTVLVADPEEIARRIAAVLTEAGL